MIVKTGANYQNDGGYIEASIDDGVISIVKNDRDISFHDTDSVVTGFVPVSITNSTDSTIFPTCLETAGGMVFIGASLSGVPAGETKVMYLPRDIVFRLGYSLKKFISDNINFETIASGAQHFAKIADYPADGLNVTLTAED